MNTQFRSIIVVVVSVLTLVLNANAQSYFFGTPFIKNYKPEEFSGGIQSWGFAQDSREIMYIANNFGLIEYDGAAWSNFSVKNGTKVRSIYITDDDLIFVGCQADFGFFKENQNGILQYVSLADSLPERFRNFDEVWRIFPLADGIAFLTFKNIYLFQTQNSTIRVIEPGSPVEFSFLVNKILYTQISGKGLATLKGDKLELVPGHQFYLDKQVVAILPFDKEHLLIFTNGEGAFLYNGFESKPLPLIGHKSIGSPIINQALMLHDGNFAIATQDNGLIIIDRQGTVLMNISRENGLLDQTVHALYQDVHDNLWLGLNNGISLIELSSPFSLIDGKMGLAGTGYAALQWNDELYLGTNSGLFKSKLTTKKLQFEQLKNTNGQVYHIAGINNKLLLGHHNGAFWLDQGQFKNIGSEKGAWAFIAHPQKRDHIIMGTYQGLSVLIDKGPTIEYAHKLAGFEESSRVLQFDDEARLWMTHGYKGVFSFEFDPALKSITNTQFYNSKNGFPSDQLINMERIKNELIFPASVGIYSFDDAQNSFKQNTRLSSIFMPTEHLVEMEEDVLGNIYFISDMRVGKLSFDKFGAPRFDLSVFRKITDMLNDDLSFIHILDPANVLFGAKEGFVHYNANKPKMIKPFHTHINQVYNTSSESDSLMISGKQLNRSERLKLSFNQNSLRFVYSSSFYENPEKTEYAYLLENFDQGYSEWSHKNDKEYTNLPEGRYTFKVKARNIYGELSTAESFSFIIKPPFYRTPLAYVIYFFSSLLVLGFAVRMIDKRYKKERKLIMLKQQRELNQKDSEIRTITDKSEQAIMRLRNEKLQSEIDHMNRELTSSTIHLINKNELLSSVKDNMEDIIKRNGRSGHTEELRKIIKNIDQNINSDGDWKQFELHFNHVHGDFTNRLLDKFPSLTPQEIKLSAYLRLNLNTKEIAQLLNISVRGVEISRYRLRKKLNLDRNDNLTDFILKF